MCKPTTLTRISLYFRSGPSVAQKTSSELLDSASGLTVAFLSPGVFNGLHESHSARTLSIMSDPLVSIILRSFNEGWALRETLPAVQAQEYRNWELIVVDSGSTDGSVELIRGQTHAFHSN